MELLPREQIAFPAHARCDPRTFERFGFLRWKRR
jgi:hypothetical protein